MRMDIAFFCLQEVYRVIDFRRVALAVLIVTAPHSSMAGAVELNWVGCGISKKAYVTDLASAFENNTGIKINVQGGGATKGIREVHNRVADLGGSCRYLLPEDPREAGTGMEPVAWDALVVVVHNDNPVDSISLQQVRDLYRGKINNWSQLGGPDQPIELYTRKSKNSGVGRLLRKLLFSDFDMQIASTQAFKSSGPLEKAIETSPNAIAISGVSSARLRNFKILKLDDIEPTVDNIRSGNYKLYRPLYLTYNPDSPNIDTVRQFISFVHSREGRDTMRKNGVVPYREALHLLMKQIQQDTTAFDKDASLVSK